MQHPANQNTNQLSNISFYSEPGRGIIHTRSDKIVRQDGWTDCFPLLACNSRILICFCRAVFSQLYHNPLIQMLTKFVKLWICSILQVFSMKKVNLGKVRHIQDNLCQHRFTSYLFAFYFGCTCNVFVRCLCSVEEAEPHSPIFFLFLL